MFPIQTIDEAVARYGAIDWSIKVWPDEPTWMGLYVVARGHFKNWTVMDTMEPVAHIYCNCDLMFPLQNAFNNIMTAGLSDQLLTFDGCWQIRQVRGQSAISAHAYGIAIDLNAAQNQLGDTTGGFYDQPELVKCFIDAGFHWGGNFAERKDPMHFSAINW